MAQNFISVAAQVEATRASLNNIEKGQWPFALAKALTNTAKDAQAAVQARTRGQFSLKTNFIPGGIRIKPAKKSDVIAYGLAEAEIFTAARISAFMPHHEYGEIREPFAGKGGPGDKGRTIAIPGRDLMNLPGVRTATGRIAKKYKPSTLLARYNQGNTTSRNESQRGKRRSRRRGSEGAAFITTARSGQLMIVRREAKSRYALQRLYILVDEAKIKRTWGFENEVEQTVRRNFLANLRRALREASA